MNMSWTITIIIISYKLKYLSLFIIILKQNNVYLRPGIIVVIRNFPFSSVIKIPRQNQSDGFFPPEYTPL